MTRRLTFDEAATALEGGRVIVVPTDTVYGVAASLSAPEAIEGIFRLKRRPRDVALPLLIADVGDLDGLGVTLDERASRLVGRWWPGALTVVVGAPRELADAVGARDASVGLRQPDDATLRRLLQRCGPLVVTSANEHGDPPAESAEDVLRIFADRDGWAGVLDDGPRHGRVSSLVDLTGVAPRIVRHGAISDDDLAATWVP